MCCSRIFDESYVFQNLVETGIRTGGVVGYRIANFECPFVTGKFLD
jgi:hypothetical protein